MGVSSYFTNCSRDPLWQFDFSTETRGPEEQNAVRLAIKMKELTEHLQDEMARAQAKAGGG